MFAPAQKEAVFVVDDCPVMITARMDRSSLRSCSKTLVSSDTASLSRKVELVWVVEDYCGLGAMSHLASSLFSTRILLDCPEVVAEKSS